MFEFTLFRIPVRVEPWHWAILALLGLSGSSFDNREDLMNLLLFILAGFFSILIHEMGHALTGRHFGARDPQVILHGMGGVAIFPSPRFTRMQHFLMVLAGPGVQLILGGIAYLLLKEFAEVRGINEFLSSLMWVSIFWAILNLCPIWPLDGGQMLKTALGPGKELNTHKVGMGFAAFCIIFSLLPPQTVYSVIQSLSFLPDFILLIILNFTRLGTFGIILFGFLGYQNYQMFKEYGGGRR